MNPRYVQTFRRHRLLFGAPIILAVIISLWFAAGSAPAYESTTSLWFDNPVGGQSLLTQNNGIVLPPAAEAQQILSELLTTRSFRLAVGDRSPLAGYVAANPTRGWSPTALIKRVLGTGSVDDRIVSALGPKEVLLTVAGPQVLAINLRAGSPEVASGTLKSLVRQFETDRGDALRTQAQASLAYLQRQVDQASKANDAARRDLASYVSSHPGSTTLTDSTLQALTQTAQTAASQLTDATNALDQANVQLSAPLSSGGVEVLDAPRTPTGPVSGHKKLLLTLFGGLLVGVLVSGLGIVFYAGREKTADDQAAPSVEAAADQAAPSAEAAADGIGFPVTTLEAAAAGVAIAETNGFATALADPAILRGTIVAVHDEGVGRRTRPVWTIRQESGEVAALPADSRVTVSDLPSRSGVVRDVRSLEDGTFEFEVEITNGKRAIRGGTGLLAIPPADLRWLSAEVSLMQKGASSPAREQTDNGWRSGQTGEHLAAKTDPQLEGPENGSIAEAEGRVEEDNARSLPTAEPVVAVAPVEELEASSLESSWRDVSAVDVASTEQPKASPLPGAWPERPVAPLTSAEASELRRGEDAWPDEVAAPSSVEKTEPSARQEALSVRPAIALAPAPETNALEAAAETTSDDADADPSNGERRDKAVWW